jgi:hypothetical protein
MGLVAGAGAARGAMFTYDLRFEDGSHTAIAVPGNSYTVDVWGVVTGTNGTTIDDGIQDHYLNIRSTQIGGGRIAFGGITSLAVKPEFQSWSGTAALFRNGGGADLNGDGVVDWGSSSAAIADTNYAMARAGSTVYGGGTVGQSINANSWEFKIASFLVSAQTVAGEGSTTFNIVKPAATSGAAVYYAVTRIDGASMNVSNVNQQGAFTSATGVTFVPEPASGGVLAASAIALFGRRRSRN